MFGNGRQRHVMRPCEIGNAPIAASQVRQNSPAGGISQGGESSVQRFRRIFNHLVKYVTASFNPANLFLALQMPATKPSPA
jgi:hypothetical protein